MILKETKSVLCQLMNGIDQLDFDRYTHRGAVLFGSSIGGHTRHIVELYRQLLWGYGEGVVDYDNRQRNMLIETNVDAALESIAEIISSIDRPDKPMVVRSIYFPEKSMMVSSYYRELLYNVEHCVHHQAIIKIALQELGITRGDEDFGVAKSTLLYREQCAR